MERCLQEILEMATIRFPEEIGLEEAQEMVYYVLKKLPGRAHYHCGYHMSAGKSFEYDSFYSQRGTVDIAGMITREDGSAFDGFNGIISRGEDTSKFAGMRFSVVPGWDLSEYRREVLNLWSDVRKYVNEYFQEKKNTKPKV